MVECLEFDVPVNCYRKTNRALIVQIILFMKINHIFEKIFLSYLFRFFPEI